MKRYKKKIGIILLIFLAVFILLGTSFALWRITLRQANSNVITTSCFKIYFNDENPINLQEALPITDEEGGKLTPYTFTIENICSTSAFYQINLEELTSTQRRLSNNYIKVSLNKSTGKILSAYQSVDITLDNADISHKLTTGRLSENETKDFELRLWLSEDTPLNEDTISASFMSKVTIITVHKKNFDNDLNVEAKSLTEDYTNTEETIEFKVTSRDYNIIEVSEDNITFNPVDVPAKKVTINKTYTEDGTYTMYFKDEVGNIIEKTVDTTRLDKIAPTIKVEANELQDGIKVNLSKSTDNKSGIKKYYYKLNDSEYIESTSSTHTFTNLPDGKYNITVKLEDNAENFTDEKTLEVTVAYEHVYISSTGSDESGNGSIDLPYATLQRAYNKVKSGGEMILLSDITATTTTNMNVTNKEVNLRGDNNNVYSISKASTLTEAILNITSSNIITINNVIFDGKSVTTTKGLLNVNSATLNLNENVTVKNSVNTASFATGSIVVITGNLNIDGAVITNNIAQSNNAQGGGVYLNASTMNMYSGEIKNNQIIGGAYGQGAGVFIWQSTFNMYGGSIYKNSGKEGGGIYLVGETIPTYFNLFAGSIYSNEASLNGGGIMAHKSGNSEVKAFLKGGTVADNTAPNGPNTSASNGAQITS